MRCISAVLAISLLAACASVPDTAEEAALRERPERPRLHTDLVRSMLAQGQPYAALAHIEELERSEGAADAELRLMRASALYALDRHEAAQTEYQRLLSTAHAGQAHHGLALIAARRDLRTAVRHFNRAVALRPTDADIRNDLGYTLMLAGRLTEARHHLATATELAPESQNAKVNLILSHMLAGDGRAQELARKHGIPDAKMQQLKAESRLIERLIGERAGEFTAADTTTEEWQDYEQDVKRRRTAIPGLYGRDGG